MDSMNQNTGPTNHFVPIKAPAGPGTQVLEVTLLELQVKETQWSHGMISLFPNPSHSDTLVLNTAINA